MSYHAESERGEHLGGGLGILVNANAKRGGRRVAAQIAHALPEANVRLTKGPEEIDQWLRSLGPMRCLLAAGGDGSAVALINALARVAPAGDLLPPIGILPLGTGNAWAHVTGAQKLYLSLRALTQATRPLPFRRFGLVDCEGTLTHFAGSGWDAQILEDFRAQVAAAKGPSRRLAKSVYGYLTAVLLHTAPRALMQGRPHVLIENLGDEVFTMTADRKIMRLSDVGHGSVLYDGLAGVAGAATCPEFGYRFRAFPFAERLPGYLNVRICNQGALSAVVNIPKLWRGAHPMPGVVDWFAKRVRMTFSREVPLEIGGDAIGMRRTIEYAASARSVDVLDWRRLRF